MIDFYISLYCTTTINECLVPPFMEIDIFGTYFFSVKWHFASIWKSIMESFILDWNPKMAFHFLKSSTCVCVWCWRSWYADGRGACCVSLGVGRLSNSSLHPRGCLLCQFLPHRALDPTSMLILSDGQEIGLIWNTRTSPIWQIETPQEEWS